MITIRLIRRDKEKFEFTYRAYKSFDGQGVTVGVHPDKNRRQDPRDRIGNAELAMVHEYGLNGLPERSFLRGALAAKGTGRAHVNKVFREDLPRVLRGHMTAADLNDRIGRLLVDAVHDRMDSDVPPPNTELTEERKRGPGTLRESLQMYDSIGYKVGRQWRS